MKNKEFMDVVLGAIRKGNKRECRKRKQYVILMFAFGLLFVGLFFGQPIYDDMTKPKRCKIVIDDNDVNPIITGVNVPQVVTYHGIVFRRTFSYEVLCERLEKACTSSFCKYKNGLCSCHLPKIYGSVNDTNQ